MLAFLACQREQVDVRIGQIQWQIRYRHEQRYLPPGEGWDDSRHEGFGKRFWFPGFYSFLHPERLSPRSHELAARRGLSLIASLGMFLTIEALYLFGAVLCSILAFGKEPPMPARLFLLVLLAVALAGLLLTILVMQHKRHR